MLKAQRPTQKAQAGEQFVGYIEPEACKELKVDISACRFDVWRNGTQDLQQVGFTAKKVSRAPVRCGAKRKPPSRCLRSEVWVRDLAHNQLASGNELRFILKAVDTQFAYAQPICGLNTDEGSANAMIVQMRSMRGYQNTILGIRELNVKRVRTRYPI